MLLIVDSDSPQHHIGKKAIRNLRSVAEAIRDNMILSFCDVAKEPYCRELVVKFELEDHDLPIVRILFRMDSSHEDEVGQEQDFYKFAFNREFYKSQIKDIENGNSTNCKILI